MPSTNGKVCYIEIPAVDIDRSADFYVKVFGWRTRQRGDGQTAFDDTTGQVSGTWIVGRRAASEPGLLVYIMVDSLAATVDSVIANGGSLIPPTGVGEHKGVARFSDPAGNVIGLYEEPNRSTSS